MVRETRNVWIIIQGIDQIERSSRRMRTNKSRNRPNCGDNEKNVDH
ncbi:hypothetical protein BSG1_09723 [Bacillus sp. SG-1]|nr:hypothetical protein BSG1_09723 [Bacillus sp. SG-1]